MLLNNFCAMLQLLTVKDINGNDTSFSNDYNAQNILTKQYHQFGTGGGGTWLVVGKGNTPTTQGDYQLADPISYIASTNSSSAAWKFSNGLNWASNGIIISNIHMVGRTATYVNNTNEDVTIKEIGLNAWSYHGSNDGRSFLIARKVLETPVIITPGNAYTFSYEVRIPTSE